MTDHAKAFERMTDDSGQGSSLEFTKPYREFLDWFIHEHQIASVLDLGCGDLRIWEGVHFGATTYRGIDILPCRIKANRTDLPCMCANILDSGPWYGGLIHCKDVLQHWPILEIRRFFNILHSSYFRFALITNCNYPATICTNSQIELGDWRPLDITTPPFSIGRKVFSWGEPNKDVVLIEP